MTLIDLRPPDWQKDARCLEHCWELFYPPQGNRADGARKVCGGCDVRQTCLDWALAIEAEQGSMPGVFGGMTQSARAQARRKKRPCATCGTEFLPRNTAHVNCSDECLAASDAHKERKAAYEKKRQRRNAA